MEGEGREEGGGRKEGRNGKGEGRRRKCKGGMVEGEGRRKGFTHLFCDPTSQETIVSVFLMTANSPVTVEVNTVVWKIWNLMRMDLEEGHT